MVAGGAILFSVWEEWNLFDGAYYSFITLSTIGFGDIVPGQSLDEGSQEKLIVCALYLLFGMALIAMCFKLMQDDVVQKARWLGQRIGIIVREEEDLSETDSEDEDGVGVVGFDDEIEAVIGQDVDDVDGALLDAMHLMAISGGGGEHDGGDKKTLSSSGSSGRREDGEAVGGGWAQAEGARRGRGGPEEAAVGECITSRIHRRPSCYHNQEHEPT